MLWCVDTSAWIDAVRLYNPASPLFDPLWAFLEQETIAGRVISPKAVLDELREKTLRDSPQFAAFIKRVKGTLFVEETPELQGRFVVIVNRYPELTKKGKPFAKSDADAWVIGLAQERGAVIVAQQIRVLEQFRRDDSQTPCHHAQFDHGQEDRREVWIDQ